MPWCLYFACYSSAGEIWFCNIWSQHGTLFSRYKEKTVSNASNGTTTSANFIVQYVYGIKLFYILFSTVHVINRVLLLPVFLRRNLLLAKVLLIDK